MAIKRRRKISYYKVARLIIILIMVVGAFCYHNEIAEALLTPEPQQESAEEMSAKYRARLQEKEDFIRHQKTMDELKAKSVAEQEAKLQAQQEADKARSEKERADFIEHRRDPHGPVTIAQ